MPPRSGRVQDVNAANAQAGQGNQVVSRSEPIAPGSVTIDMSQGEGATTPAATTTTATILNSLSSTSMHRNTQRSAAFAEVASAAVSSVATEAAMPFQFAQAMLSIGSGIFSKTLKTPERIVQFTQGGASLLRFGLSVVLYCANDPCNPSALSNICRALVIANQVYSATLIVAGTIAESSKEPYPGTLPSPAPNSSPA